MTQRLTQMLDEAKASSKKQLWAALVAGDPNPAASVECMCAMAQSGVDGLELIWPFNLPSYHSAVIQRACARALVSGVELEPLAQLIEAFRAQDQRTPVIVSSYLNRFSALPRGAAFDRLAAAGADGLMFNDISWEPDSPWVLATESRGLAYVCALSPVSAPARQAQILDQGKPLTVYTGHLGQQHTQDKAQALERLQGLAHHDGALIASMQISTPLEARAVSQFCDGVLVGSAFVWLIEGRGQEMAQRLGTFAKELKAALGA